MNWQQLQATMQPEVQRLEDERQQQLVQQQAEMQKQLGRLSDIAGQQAARGRFEGFEGLPGYAELMKQRDAALKADQAREAGVSPWEMMLRRGAQEGQTQAPTESPWASLSSRLAGESSKYARQASEARQRKAAAEADAWQRAFAKSQEEARRRAQPTAPGTGNLRRGEEYTRWANSVNRRAAQGGGIGAGAYYDTPNPDWQQD